MNPHNIANDATIMKEMVLAAKMNDFDKVEKILKEKNHIINGIPTERAWSALHQAVHHQNVKAVKMLLAFENCDRNVRAKRDRAGLTSPGDEPIKLAKSQELKTLLDKKNATLLYDVPTFMLEILGNIYIKEGIPLFLMSPAFLEENVAKKLKQNYDEFHDFYELCQHFFGLIKANLDTVKSSLAESFYVIAEDLYTKIDNIITFDDFVREMICIYTSGSISIQRKVNFALRNSSEKLNPTGEDLLLCLYAFILETFLLSSYFPSFSGTTYRGITLTPNQLSMYEAGKTFYWMSFTSSSKAKDSSFPGNVEFIFDNDCNSKWRPRDISSYSQIPNEAEMLYPAGAKFKVTSVHQTESADRKEIYLRLIE